MVIECKHCSKKFYLNEKLLKPAGSRVRCSKCGNIFHAYPAYNDISLNPAFETDGKAKDFDQNESAPICVEKRKHPRVPVSIHVLCDALDLEGNQRDIHVGVIKDVSQTGLAIELFRSPICEQVSLSFINVENSEVKIKANVVHSRMNSVKTWIGLSLMGLPMEIDHFFTQVLQIHHISYGADREVPI